MANALRGMLLFPATEGTHDHASKSEAFQYHVPSLPHIPS